MITMCTVRSTDADGAIEEHWQVYDPGTAKRLAAGVGRKFPDRRIDVKQETITHVITSIMIPADELEGLPRAKAASTANDWSNRGRVKYPHGSTDEQAARSSLENRTAYSCPIT